MAVAVLWRHLAWDGTGDWHDAGHLTSQSCTGIWGICFLALLSLPLFVALGASGFYHTQKEANPDSYAGSKL